VSLDNRLRISSVRRQISWNESFSLAKLWTVILHSAAAPHMEETRRQFLPIRFGIFEVDLQAGELRRQGHKVKLQDQPFQVLVMLLEHPGEVVTREELQKKLWPADTFVDFERGLNRAINKLREGLGDDADSPRFIETLPRRGYRFVPPVEKADTREVETAGRNRLTLVPTDLPHKVEDNVSTAAAPMRQVLPWVAAGALAVVAVFGYWKPWRAPQIVADRPFSQLDLDVGPDEFSEPAISRDGSRIVFVSRGALAIRRLDQTKTTRLAGTEGGFLPFFSPNGQWVAFFAARKLQKVPIEGGAPVALCDAAGPGGGSWGEDDNIVVALDASRGLSRVPAAGGAPKPLTDSKSDPSGGLMHSSPQVLPGGKGVLFTAANASARFAQYPWPEWQAPNGGRGFHLRPLSRQRICGLQPAGDAVCGAHGREPAGVDGPGSASCVLSV
jgi:DNA-binding winged helix-turn-helix (wHTH) protein